MRLFTPRGLHYPITVTKLIKEPGEEIELNQPLFTYSYEAFNIEYDDFLREDVKRSKKFYSQFESELEGHLKRLDVQVGQVIAGRAPVAEVEEVCQHTVQYGSLCADCGKDMTEVQYSSTTRNSDRATVNTVHSNTQLLVSQDEANRADEEAKRRLLNSKKLSLVVDLDQTIIHATVDPTVAEWQKDVDNPNHNAVKDVRAFQLSDDGPGARSCWYYIKLRPGLEEFLQTIAQHYELHIYTMGTRAYAENIAKIIDPERKLFGNRVLSRNESGSMTAKNLKRLFPVDSKMVVIIDDRGDVWQWSPNLVKVPPYDFFVGIGDINSSFLPKRPELEIRTPKFPSAESSKPSDTTATSPNGDSVQEKVAQAKQDTSLAVAMPQANGDVSAVDQMVSMAGKQDEGSLKEKTEEQDETLAAQLADRPLLQKQKVLDAAEEDAKASPAVEAATEILAGNGDDQQPTNPEHHASKYRHNLLQDDDTELQHLRQSLLNIHSAYFTEYDESLAERSPTASRVADLRASSTSSKPKSRPLPDYNSIPDAALIIAAMKRRVLAGVHLVFSGVFPLGTDVQSQDTAVWAKSFGATVSENLTRRTTHVIASPDRRTAKVRQAGKRGGRVAIVRVEWLAECLSLWRRVPEGPYRVHSEAVGEEGKHGGELPESFGEGDGRGLLSESEEDRGGIETGTGTESEGEGPTATLHKEVVGELEPAEGSSSEGIDGGKENWEEVDDELAEFLGSEADDESDNESVSRASESGRKRKRDGADTELETEIPEGEGDEEGSRLQKRKKEAQARSSGLALTAKAAAEPASGTTDPRPEAGNAPAADEGADDDADDFDLEAALAAEMEKE